jgi:hypothetical protein
VAITRQQVVFTYTSQSGGETYRFDIVVDALSNVAVRNIQGPLGAISGLASIPSSVMADIQVAMEAVLVLTSDAEAIGGTLVFQGETSVTVALPGGTLNNTNYRVAYTTPDGVLLTTANKATTSFDAVASVAYGTPSVPKTVAYSVLVATVQGSNYSGQLTFTEGDAGQKTVTFARALESNAYRVVLTVGGFFVACVVSRGRTGFTVQIGHTLGAGETVDVGYDVFL